jgi:hypothetical protein
MDRSPPLNVAVPNESSHSSSEGNRRSWDFRSLGLLIPAIPLRRRASCEGLWMRTAPIPSQSVSGRLLSAAHRVCNLNCWRADPRQRPLPLFGKSGSHVYGSFPGAGKYGKRSGLGSPANRAFQKAQIENSGIQVVFKSGAHPWAPRSLLAAVRQWVLQSSTEARRS